MIASFGRRKKPLPSPACIDTFVLGGCQTFAEAQSLVRLANCMASGDLARMPKPFVYHPATNAGASTVTNVKKILGAGTLSTIKSSTKNVVKTLGAGAASAASAVGTLAKKGGKADLNAATSVPFAGLVFGVGVAAWETYDATKQYEYTMRVKDLWPENWTKYDFLDIVDALGHFQDYLAVQETYCYNVMARYNMNLSYEPLYCPNVTLLMTDGSLAAHTQVPTMCWANARPSLGQSSLLSCTSESTCCHGGACDSLTEGSLVR